MSNNPGHKQQQSTSVPGFFPAKPRGWVIWLVQELIRLDLFLHNQIHVQRSQLELLRHLPIQMGTILTLNHADESDFKLCLALARLSGRKFLYMVNSEVFAEAHGMAGWWLQRLGAFSVERGGNNSEAKQYAVQQVKKAHETLVVFPEGEIHYLNDLVQPFKSGAVDIGMRAVVEMQAACPDWTVYVMPVAIKYRYRKSIRSILEQRVRKIERHLSRRIRTSELQYRLALIIAEVLHRQELLHHLNAGSARLSELNGRVEAVRQAILLQLEEKYSAKAVKTMDGPWRLSSHLRNLLQQVRTNSALNRSDLYKDLITLKRISHMGSWQPDYVDLDPSQERLAEMVLKLEREVYGVKRVHQLADRDVFIKIGDAISLRDFLQDYLRNPQEVRHRIAEQLRDMTQALVDAIIYDGINEHKLR